MDELFGAPQIQHEPLAARMRPRTLDEYIGQDHIVGKGRLLRRAIAADQLTSVIFYGPPGSGKTTLARVIANHTKSNFITLNAVLTGVADIRKAIADAEGQRKLYSKKTILFVDEVQIKFIFFFKQDKLSKLLLKLRLDSALFLNSDFNLEFLNILIKGKLSLISNVYILFYLNFFLMIHYSMKNVNH